MSKLRSDCQTPVYHIIIVIFYLCLEALTSYTISVPFSVWKEQDTFWQVPQQVWWLEEGIYIWCWKERKAKREKNKYFFKHTVYENSLISETKNTKRNNIQMDGWICLRMLLEIASQNNPGDTRYTSLLFSSSCWAKRTSKSLHFDFYPNCVTVLTNCIIPVF